MCLKSKESDTKWNKHVNFDHLSKEIQKKTVGKSQEIETSRIEGSLNRKWT